MRALGSQAGCNLEMSWQFNVLIINHHSSLSLLESDSLWSLPTRLFGAERSVSWVDLSPPGLRSVLRCWWFPTMDGCCSAEGTGTAVSASRNWERASWWAGSAGTLVSYIFFFQYLSFDIQVLWEFWKKRFVFLCVSTKMLLLAWLWISVASTSSLVQGTPPA